VISRRSEPSAVLALLLAVVVLLASKSEGEAPPLLAVLIGGLIGSGAVIALMGLRRKVAARRAPRTTREGLEALRRELLAELRRIEEQLPAGFPDLSGGSRAPQPPPDLGGLETLGREDGRAPGRWSPMPIRMDGRTRSEERRRAA